MAEITITEEMKNAVLLCVDPAAALTQTEIYDIVEALWPLIAAAEREACVQEAKAAIYGAANKEYRTKTLKLRRSASCVDYAKAAEAAIRARKETSNDPK